jgi:hypothetical protein
VADARSAASHALDRLHQAQQEVVTGPRPAGGVGLGDDQVQHGDALEAVAHVEDHADRPRELAVALDGEQALRIGFAADADAQRLAFVHDLGRTVAVDRRLDALADPVLATIEEQQGLELVIMLGRQRRDERYLSTDGRHSQKAPSMLGQATIRA